jgi:hypothetical protein
MPGQLGLLTCRQHGLRFLFDSTEMAPLFEIRDPSVGLVKICNESIFPSSPSNLAASNRNVNSVRSPEGSNRSQPAKKFTGLEGQWAWVTQQFR